MLDVACGASGYASGLIIPGTKENLDDEVLVRHCGCANSKKGEKHRLDE